MKYVPSNSLSSCKQNKTKIKNTYIGEPQIANSLWLSDAIWWQRTWSTLAQMMACCLAARSHYLNQCWLIISVVQLQLAEGNFTRGNVETQWSHLKPRVQSMYLLFVSWQLDHFWLRYSQFNIWPWKFKVKVMAKVKPNGHIWSLEFSRYVCFLFRGNRTIFGWDIANSIFDLENSRSRSRRKSTKI